MIGVWSSHYIILIVQDRTCCEERHADQGGICAGFSSRFFLRRYDGNNKNLQNHNPEKKK